MNQPLNLATHVRYVLNVTPQLLEGILTSLHKVAALPAVDLLQQGLCLDVSKADHVG